MAERKAVNKYYPPDWDPSKGSVNKYQGSHPLRDRAKKLSQGILTIRFELPYNIWCGGCNSHIGMGVRYNAEKKKVGNYYSTPIYKFRMKCHLCDNYFEIQTDPKNHDYVILSGARRKEQRWDPKENEQIVPEEKATHKKLATDAMYKLEHGSDDINKKKSVIPSLHRMEQRLLEKKDDYLLNKLARKKFRDQKIAVKKREEKNRNLLKKSSLDINLVNEDERDIKLAGLLKYRALETYDEKQQQKRKEIENRSLFEVTETATSPASSSFSSLDNSMNSPNTMIKKLGLNVNTSSNPFNVNNTSKMRKTKSLPSLGVCVKASPKISDKKCDTSIDSVSNDNLVLNSETNYQSTKNDDESKRCNINDSMEVEYKGDDSTANTSVSEKLSSSALSNLSAYDDSDISD